MSMRPCRCVVFAVIVPSVRQSSMKGPQRSPARGDGLLRVDPSRAAGERKHQSGHTKQSFERRASESVVNAAALHLGIAAQMLASREAVHDAPMMLPLDPAMRMAARYASTAQGVAATSTLGFQRTI